MATIIINHLSIQGTPQELEEFVEWSKLNKTSLNLNNNYEFEPSNDRLYHNEFIDFFQKQTGIKIDRIRICATEDERIVICMDSWNCHLRKVAIAFAQRFPNLRFVLEDMQDIRSHREFILSNGKWCLLDHETSDLDDSSSWQTSITAAGHYEDYSDTATEERRAILHPDLIYFARSELLLSEYERSKMNEEYDDRLLHRTVATNQWPSGTTDEHESS